MLPVWFSLGVFAPVCIIPATGMSIKPFFRSPENMRHPILLLSLLATPLLPRAQEFQIVYKVTGSVLEETATGVSEKGLTPGHWVVRLGPDYTCLAESAGMTVHDYKGKRVLRFITDVKTSDHSLFALPARRQTDFARQMESLGLLRRAGLAGANIDAQIHELENRLGMKSGLPLSTRPVKSRDPAGNYAYLMENRLTASFTMSETEVPEDRRRMFSRFLMTALPMHPDLRADLETYHRVPSRLKIRTMHGDQKRYTTLELLAAGPAADLLYGEVQRAPVPPAAGSRLARLVRRSLNPEEHDRLPRGADDFATGFNNAIQQGFHTDAMLVALECYLQVGDSTDKAVDALLPYSKRDPALGNFLASMALAGDPSTANKAVEALNKIDRDSLLRKHLFDFSVANALASLGKLREAEGLYLATLDQNPLLAGVYVKLGQLYYDSERMEDAWLCWDTARMLRPDHPMLTIPRGVEARLMKELPDCF